VESTKALPSHRAAAALTESSPALLGWLVKRFESESIRNSRSHPSRWRGRLGYNPWRSDRLGGQDDRILDKETKNEPTGACRTWRKKSAPAFLPQPFADVLIGRPCFAAWSRQCQPDAHQSIRITEIGDLERRDAVTPHVSGELLHRRYAPLSQMAVPLSP